MRKDIAIEKIMLGGDFVNKSALARQYGCCWETIDRRLNPDKYKKDKNENKLVIKIVKNYKKVLFLSETAEKVVKIKSII